MTPCCRTPPQGPLHVPAPRASFPWKELALVLGGRRHAALQRVRLGWWLLGASVALGGGGSAGLLVHLQKDGGGPQTLGSSETAGHRLSRKPGALCSPLRRPVISVPVFLS